MIKRNMKKLAPEAYAAFDVDAMVEAFCAYVRMGAPETVVNTKEPHYVLVLFTGDRAELKVFEKDGVTEACGVQTGPAGKFMVFTNDHPYKVSGPDHYVVRFRERV